MDRKLSTTVHAVHGAEPTGAAERGYPGQSLMALRRSSHGVNLADVRSCSESFGAPSRVSGRAAGLRGDGQIEDANVGLAPVIGLGSACRAHILYVTRGTGGVVVLTSHCEDVTECFVDRKSLLRADRADVFTETGQVNGRELFDQYPRDGSIDRDLRPEVGRSGGCGRWGDDDG